MPGICDSTDFGLSDENRNRVKARYLLKKKSKVVIWETDTHLFFRTGDWASGGHIVLYEKTEQLITYFVKFEVRHRGFGDFHKTVTQTAVWKSDTDPVNRGMAEKVFVDILLNHYGAIMSDIIQTPRGQSFWITQMTQADAQGYGVAFVDFNQRKILKKTPGVTMRAWVAERKTWREQQKCQAERFLIYKK